MAKYTITYKCGHAGIVELYGKWNERERKIERYKNHVCPECYEAAQAAKCAAAEQKYVFPELTNGSERQIAWARTIRLKFVALRENQAKRNEKRYEKFSQKDIEKHKAMFRAFCDEFFGETSAKAWIDRRNNVDDEWRFENEFYEYIRAHLND